jgi:hypothetical protein
MILQGLICPGIWPSRDWDPRDSDSIGFQTSGNEFQIWIFPQNRKWIRQEIGGWIRGYYWIYWLTPIDWWKTEIQNLLLTSLNRTVARSFLAQVCSWACFPICIWDQDFEAKINLTLFSYSLIIRFFTAPRCRLQGDSRFPLFPTEAILNSCSRYTPQRRFCWIIIIHISFKIKRSNSTIPAIANSCDFAHYRAYLECLLRKQKGFEKHVWHDQLVPLSFKS